MHIGLPESITHRPTTKDLAFVRRRADVAGLQLTWLVLAYALAFTFRFGLRWPPDYLRTFLETLPILLSCSIATALLFGLVSQTWRFTDTSDLREVVLSTAGATLAFVFIADLLGVRPRIPIDVIVLDFVFTSYGLAAARVEVRSRWERRVRRSQPGSSVRNVLIVGAGEAGDLLAREFERYPGSQRRPVGYLDDDRGKSGTRLRGIPVLGTTQDLPITAREKSVHEVIVAIPSATPAQLRRIVERVPEGLSLTVLPALSEVVRNEVRLTQLRELTIEDLLGRDPIQLELPELAEHLAGRTVLVTGAAGSIGSELSRQVAANRPGRLLLLDQAESDLYLLERELDERFPDLDTRFLVADVLDSARLERIFEECAPAVVFHAAAYKHVPLMETNPAEAIGNNVLGTLSLARTSARHGVERFVLISTDKAVQPCNIMGATKRLAEMTLRACAQESPGTTFSAVRFGNVLGSQGSVLPIFRAQLEAGEALTVTHPRVSRFFMTIPEAVRLVLEASLPGVADGGIVMLDMGEPVRILDLARLLLRLSGCPPEEQDRRIRFVGLRPGERLHEQLIEPGERRIVTTVDKVYLVETDAPPPAAAFLEQVEGWWVSLEEGRVETVLSEMWSLCRAADPVLRREGGGEGSGTAA